MTTHLQPVEPLQPVRTSASIERSSNRLRYLFDGIVVVVCVTFALVQLYVTRGGLGLSPDSTVYLQFAENLRDGRGYQLNNFAGELVPQTHWPPIYPAVLAMLSTLGPDPRTVAYWLGAGLLSANLFLLATLSRRVFPGDVNGRGVAAILAALFGGLSLEVTTLHAMLLSEPLFMTLVMAGLLVFDRCIRRPTVAVSTTAGLLFGLASITRYAGTAFVVAPAAVLVWRAVWRTQSAQKNAWSTAVSFCLAAVLPLAIWIGWGAMNAQGVGNRLLLWHPVTGQNIAVALNTMAGWATGARPGTLGQSQLLGSLVLLLILFVGGLSWFHQRQSGRSSIGRLAGGLTEHPADKSAEDDDRRSVIGPLLTGMIVVYLVFLVASVSLLDAYIRLDFRLLLPVQMLSIVLLSGLAVPLLSGSRPTVVRVAVVIVLVLAVGVRVPRFVDWVRHAPEKSLGYASDVWRSSRTVKFLKDLPADARVYSNAADAVYACTGRRAIALPNRFDPTRQQTNVNLDRQLEQMRLTFTGSTTYLVVWNRRGLDHVATLDDVSRHFGLKEIHKFKDSTVYKMELPIDSLR